jgi:hypothetical protein
MGVGTNSLFPVIRCEHTMKKRRAPMRNGTTIITKRRGKSDTPGTEAKTYKLPLAIILEIRKAAAIYGSQGRAVQVGSEILTRIGRSLAVPQCDPRSIQRRTYKLVPRTIEVIQQLSETEYEDSGQVLAACVEALKLTKVT